MVRVWRPAVRANVTENQQNTIKDYLKWMQHPAFVEAMESYTWYVKLHLHQFEGGKYFLCVDVVDEAEFPPLFIVPQCLFAGSRHHGKPLHITLDGYPSIVEMENIKSACSGLFTMSLHKWTRDPTKSAYLVGGEVHQVCEELRCFGVRPGHREWHMSL